MLKKIKEKLHKFLFPNEAQELLRIPFLENDYKSLKNEHAAFVLKTLMTEEKPKATMADLMRETLGIYTIDYTAVGEDGLPPHFLNVEDKEKRKMFIAQLAQIQELEVWPVMIKNHIDTQGNFIVRKADGETQMLCGRMTINGISLLRDEVKRGFDEYQEGRKPTEDFDEFETTEGIIINKVIENV